MVKILLSLIFLFSSAATAAEFTASVNRKQLPLSESLLLTLTLSDGKATSTPDISRLTHDFTIASQQQSSSTTIVNGKMGSSISWIYTLLPKRVGRAVIAPIALATKGGELRTKPIEVEVVKQGSAAGERGNGAIEERIAITSSVSNALPYKGEPVNYSVKVFSREDMANLRIGKIEMDDAIVEMVEEPEVKERIVDGIRIKVLEINTLITPLREGELTIPSMVIQGGFPVKERSRLSSLFDRDFDPFEMMGGFQRVEPFALTSEPVTLRVVPEVPSVVPWLPAKSIAVNESFSEGQKLEVGEPLTLSIEVKGIGVRASQLPDLKELARNNENFKIYADKPESGEKIVGHEIESFRKEQLTLIPTAPGKIALPSLEIPWWDVVEKKAKVARLEGKAIEVKAAAKRSEAATPESFSPPEAAKDFSEKEALKEAELPLYAVIAVLALLLLFTLAWILSLQRRINRIGKPVEDSAQRAEEEKIGELGAVKTPKELYLFLQSHAERHFKRGKQSTLQEIYAAMEGRLPEKLHAELKELLGSLERNLYKGEEIDIEEAVRTASRLLKNCGKEVKRGIRGEKLPDLNP